MNFADADYFLPDPPAQQRHKGRADVNGQKTQSAVDRQADTAIEGPGRAVDRQAERVDDGRAQPGAPARARPAIRAEGDGEEKGHVDDTDRDQEV